MIAQEYQPMPDPPHSPWRAVRCRRCSHPLPIPIPPGGRSSRDAVPHPPPLVDRVVPNAVAPDLTPLGTTASTFQDPWRAELPRGRSHTLSRPSFLKTAITAAFLLTWFAGLATAQTPVPPSPPVSPVTVTILCERLAPFQNERFHITLEIKATGLQIAPQIGLSGMPVPDQLVVSPFEELTPERNINAAGIAVETRRFRSRVRATQSGILELAPILEVQAQYRRRLLFGTAIESVPQTIRAQPVKLTVRALPATDRPVGFAGSIGAFTFTREAKPTELAPGELITLVSTITGDGYRVEDLPPAIPLDLEGFKVYPPRLLQKTERILSAEQVIIPLGPHAKTIPALSFAMFDPVTETYTIAKQAPIPLTFREAVKTTVEPYRPPTVSSPLPLSTRSWDTARRLTTYTGGIRLLAFLMVFMGVISLFRRAARIRGIMMVLAGILILTSIYLVERHMDQSSGLTLSQAEPVRIAPHSGALELFRLKEGTRVKLVEISGDWARIESDNRTGWVPSPSLP